MVIFSDPCEVSADGNNVFIHMMGVLGNYPSSLSLGGGQNISFRMNKCSLSIVHILRYTLRKNRWLGWEVECHECEMEGLRGAET